jgi:hypothetical protein
VNTDERELALYRAERRVREIQTKLHRWATDDPDQQFHDLFNLVCDPAFLLVAWQRVRGNRGARAAGVDGDTAFVIEQRRGVDAFLTEIRDELEARQFRPLPVRERMIPKANGKQRRLGIATVRDRVVQAALKLVLEPIFEADFLPCSYGFRPNRRAHDAIAEIRTFASPPHRTYPSKKAVRAVTGKVRTLSRLNKNLPLEVLLHTLNPVLRGWCTYFQPGVSSATFRFLRAFAWRRVIGWLRRKHLRMNWKRLRQRYCHGGWWPTDGSVALFDPGRMRTTRYRYRGAAIPTPWASTA